MPNVINYGDCETESVLGLARVPRLHFTSLYISHIHSQVIDYAVFVYIFSDWK